MEDLNDDVILEIFDKSEIKDLVNLAEMNYRFRDLITRYCIAIKYRFEEKFLRIMVLFNEDEDSFYEDIDLSDDGLIKVHDGEIMLKILRNFGQLFSRVITILYSSEALEWHQRICSYINKYSSESLEELYVDGFRGDFILEWKKPFKRVSTVRFERGSWDCEKTNMTFSEIFPSVRSIEISQVEFSSSKCIDHHFPHLEHIHTVSNVYKN